jgi:hypothetical protein
MATPQRDPTKARTKTSGTSSGWMASVTNIPSLPWVSFTLTASKLTLAAWLVSVTADASSVR